MLFIQRLKNNKNDDRKGTSLWLDINDRRVSRQCVYMFYHFVHHSVLFNPGGYKENFDNYLSDSTNFYIHVT